jgi:tRNA pseudouridine55 synthase
VAVGREATKEIGQYVKLDKEYVATLHLGAETDTYDRTGKKTAEARRGAPPRSRNEIEAVLKNFLGRQMQVPPMFSAKKVGGKKLYELARKGIEIERTPVEIEIKELEIMSYARPFLKIRIKCSSGTYIRSLAFDIGRSLACGAYLEELVRTAVGEFRIEEAEAGAPLSPPSL